MSFRESSFSHSNLRGGNVRHIDGGGASSVSHLVATDNASHHRYGTQAASSSAAMNANAAVVSALQQEVVSLNRQVITMELDVKMSRETIADYKSENQMLREKLMAATASMAALTATNTTALRKRSSAGNEQSNYRKASSGNQSRFADEDDDGDSDSPPIADDDDDLSSPYDRERRLYAASSSSSVVKNNNAIKANEDLRALRNQCASLEREIEQLKRDHAAQSEAFEDEAARLKSELKRSRLEATEAQNALKQHLATCGQHRSSLEFEVREAAEVSLAHYKQRTSVAMHHLMDEQILAMVRFETSERQLLEGMYETMLLGLFKHSQGLVMSLHVSEFRGKVRAQQSAEATMGRERAEAAEQLEMVEAKYQDTTELFLHTLYGPVMRYALTQPAARAQFTDMQQTRHRFNAKYLQCTECLAFAEERYGAAVAALVDVYAVFQKRAGSLFAESCIAVTVESVEAMVYERDDALERLARNTNSGISRRERGGAGVAGRGVGGGAFDRPAVSHVHQASGALLSSSSSYQHQRSGSVPLPSVNASHHHHHHHMLPPSSSSQYDHGAYHSARTSRNVSPMRMGLSSSSSSTAAPRRLPGAGNHSNNNFFPNNAQFPMSQPSDRPMEPQRGGGGGYVVNQQQFTHNAPNVYAFSSSASPALPRISEMAREGDMLFGGGVLTPMHRPQQSQQNAPYYHQPPQQQQYGMVSTPNNRHDASSFMNTTNGATSVPPIAPPSFPSSVASPSSLAAFTSAILASHDLLSSFFLSHHADVVAAARDEAIGLKQAILEAQWVKRTAQHMLLGAGGMGMGMIGGDSSSSAASNKLSRHPLLANAIYNGGGANAMDFSYVMMNAFLGGDVGNNNSSAIASALDLSPFAHRAGLVADHCLAMYATMERLFVVVTAVNSSCSTQTPSSSAQQHAATRTTSMGGLFSSPYFGGGGGGVANASNTAAASNNNSTNSTGSNSGDALPPLTILDLKARHAAAAMGMSILWTEMHAEEARSMLEAHTFFLAATHELLPHRSGLLLLALQPSSSSSTSSRRVPSPSRNQQQQQFNPYPPANAQQSAAPFAPPPQMAPPSFPHPTTQPSSLGGSRLQQQASQGALSVVEAQRDQATVVTHWLRQELESASTLLREMLSKHCEGAMRRDLNNGGKGRNRKASRAATASASSPARANRHSNNSNAAATATLNERAGRIINAEEAGRRLRKASRDSRRKKGGVAADGSVYDHRYHHHASNVIGSDGYTTSSSDDDYDYDSDEDGEDQPPTSVDFLRYVEASELNNTAMHRYYGALSQRDQQYPHSHPHHHHSSAPPPADADTFMYAQNVHHVRVLRDNVKGEVLTPSAQLALPVDYASLTLGEEAVRLHRHGDVNSGAYALEDEERRLRDFPLSSSHEDHYRPFPFLKEDERSRLATRFIDTTSNTMVTRTKQQQKVTSPDGASSTIVTTLVPVTVPNPLKYHFDFNQHCDAMKQHLEEEARNMALIATAQRELAAMTRQLGGTADAYADTLQTVRNNVVVEREKIAEDVVSLSLQLEAERAHLRAMVEQFKLERAELKESLLFMTVFVGDYRELAHDAHDALVIMGGEGPRARKGWGGGGASASSSMLTSSNHVRAVSPHKLTALLAGSAAPSYSSLLGPLAADELFDATLSSWEEYAAARPYSKYRYMTQQTLGNADPNHDDLLVIGSFNPKRTTISAFAGEKALEQHVFVGSALLYAHNALLESLTAAAKVAKAGTQSLQTMREMGTELAEQTRLRKATQASSELFQQHAMAMVSEVAFTHQTMFAELNQQLLLTAQVAERKKFAESHASEALRVQVSNHEREVDAFNAQIKKLNQTIKDKEQRIQLLSTQSNAITTSHWAAGNEIASLKTEVDLRQARIEDLEQRLEMLQSVLNSEVEVNGLALASKRAALSELTSVHAYATQLSEKKRELSTERARDQLSHQRTLQYLLEASSFADVMDGGGGGSAPPATIEEHTKNANSNGGALATNRRRAWSPIRSREEDASMMVGAVSSSGGGGGVAEYDHRLYQGYAPPAGPPMGHAHRQQESIYTSLLSGEVGADSVNASDRHRESDYYATPHRAYSPTRHPSRSPSR